MPALVGIKCQRGRDLVGSDANALVRMSIADNSICVCALTYVFVYAPCSKKVAEEKQKRASWLSWPWP